MTKSEFLLGFLCLVFTPNAWGWSTEAEYLAVEISGELRPPDALAGQIETDLAAIRSAYPEFADIRVRPDWRPEELLVALTPAAYSQYTNGTFTGFDSLYAALGTPEASTYDTGRSLTLDFNQVYHGERLAELFEPVNGVRYAEPNYLFGDGNDIVARKDRTYTLSRAYGDCPAGCIYRDSWDFTVTDEGVSLGLLSIPEPAVPGDFDNSGAVDAADYVVWRDGFGSIYDEAHYVGWKYNFGATVEDSSAAIAGAPVPEPTTGVLLFIGALSGCWRYSRKR